jgi:hypothetical protein
MKHLHLLVDEELGKLKKKDDKEITQAILNAFDRME